LAQQPEPEGGKIFQTPRTPVSVGTTPLYYVTRIQPTGGEERVAPYAGTHPRAYILPVSSKAYLNVFPAINGHLVVLANKQLFFPFPASKKDVHPDFVRNNETIKIPLIFDEKPGQIDFIVAIVPDNGGNTEMVDAIHKNHRDAADRILAYLKQQTGPHKGLVQPTSDDDDLPKMLDPPGLVYSMFTLQNKMLQNK